MLIKFGKIFAVTLKLFYHLYLKSTKSMIIKYTIYTALITGFLFSIMFSCKNEYSYKDNKPQMEIVIKDQTGQLVQGAIVTLYLLQNDWNQKVNAVQTLTSDSKGTAMFTELDEKVYYFLAEKGALNNVLGVSYFAQPLKVNEIRVIQTIIN